MLILWIAQGRYRSYLFKINIDGLCIAERMHCPCVQCAVLKVAIFSADLNGVDLNPVQDTPVASRKEDTYIHFNIDVEIQKHVEKLPKGEISCRIESIL